MYKKYIIFTIIFFFCIIYKVNAIYVSNAGTSYIGSQGSCGNTENCKNGNYFIMQARLYYIDNSSFTQIGKTYYFTDLAGYNILKNKGLNIIYLPSFNSYSQTSTGYNSGFNYLNDTYFANSTNAKNFLNNVTSADDYNAVLTKESQDKGGTKGYRIIIEPAENYANPSFSSENSGLITFKGLASEIIRRHGTDANNLNPYDDLLGVGSKAQYIYNTSSDVGISSQTEDKCEDLDAEQFGDMTYGCGYKIIDINKYIIPAKCYMENGIKAKNGGLKCINYDENNNEEYSTKFIETSCQGKSESQKLEILENYGKLTVGVNACGMYCTEVAEASFPGNILNPILQGSYFAWPTRYDDITGKYPMSVKTKLVCHTIGTETKTIASVYQRTCPIGYVEYKQDDLDICVSVAEANKMCPEYSVKIDDKCYYLGAKSVTNSITQVKTDKRVCPSDSAEEGGKCYKYPNASDITSTDYVGKKSIAATKDEYNATTSSTDYVSADSYTAELDKYRATTSSTDYVNADSYPAERDRYGDAIENDYLWKAKSFQPDEVPEDYVSPVNKPASCPYGWSKTGHTGEKACKNSCGGDLSYSLIQNDKKKYCWNGGTVYYSATKNCTKGYKLNQVSSTGNYCRKMRDVFVGSYQTWNAKAVNEQFHAFAECDEGSLSGTNCVRTEHCKNGRHLYNHKCYRQCTLVEHFIEFNYSNGKCERKDMCSIDRILYNGDCYRPCDTNYTFSAGVCTRTSNCINKYNNTCYKNCIASYTFNSSTGKCTRNQSCKNGKILYDKTCYNTCDTNYSFNAGVCTRTSNCINKYNNTCYKACKSGYTFNSSTGKCTRKQSCKNGKTLYNGKCYNACNANYTFSNGKCIRNKNSCVNKYNNTCYKACTGEYNTFNSTNGTCVSNPKCKTGILYNGRCYKCSSGKFTNRKCKTEVAKDACPSDYPLKILNECFATVPEHCNYGTLSKDLKKCVTCPSGFTYDVETDRCLKLTSKICDKTMKNTVCYRNVEGNPGELIDKEYTNVRECSGTEKNGKCYKITNGTAGTKVTQTKATTTTRICPSGYPNQYNGLCYAACPSGYEFINGKCGQKKNFYCKQDPIEAKYNIVRRLLTVEDKTYCFRTKQKSCEDRKSGGGYTCNHTSGVACSGSKACRRVVSTTTTQGKTTCPSGYPNKEKVSGTYCCNSSNQCYSSSGNCESGYTKKKFTNQMICWKYISSYKCPSGYVLWSSDNNTCWKCNIGGEIKGYGGDGKETTNQNNIYSCGKYITQTSTSTNYSCSSGRLTNYNGLKCQSDGVDKSYCYNTLGGDFRQVVPGRTYVSTGGIGTCFTSPSSYTSTNSYNVWSEEGWIEASSSQVWEYKNASTSTSTKTTYEYAPKECTYDYPKSIPGLAGWCREQGSGSGMAPDCDGTVINGFCYGFTTDPASHVKDACPPTHPLGDNTQGCYTMVNLEKPYCSSGEMTDAGNCVVCSEGTLNKTTGKCEKEIAKDKCPASHPNKEGNKCYRDLPKNKHSCKTGKYIKKLDKCIICGTKQKVTSNGKCRYAYACSYPNAVDIGGKCYNTTPKETDWLCPATYQLNGTTCNNSCSKEALTSGLKTKLKTNISATLKAGTNLPINEVLITNTSTNYNDNTLTYEATTTFKINPNTNRYYNKITREVSNSTSGWNSRNVFDRKEGVVSLSLSDPIIKNGSVVDYSLEINDVHFGVTNDYGKAIKDYKCTYKTTSNACKCPSGTDFEGISVFDITDNICNIQNENRTCADLQYNICNKPDKYYCKDSSSNLVDLTSCVQTEINNGNKPYAAFLKCRINNTRCTKTCTMACTGNCVEEDKTLGNIDINITRCDGKVCSIQPYCVTDNSVVSKSSLECINQKLNLKSEDELKKAIDNNSVNSGRLLQAAKECEATICGKQKILFRTIDLENPFYGDSNNTSLSLTNNSSRTPGSNWNSVDIVTEKILKTRGTEGNALYNQTPLYVIVLTPKNIEDLREFNKTHGYSNFSVQCNGNNQTYGCISTFLHDDTESLKELNVQVTGKKECTNLNLSSRYSDFQKCYYSNN